MKASELRIGNLYDQFGNLHKVSWSTLKDLESAPESQLWCKPIPLTEEWLLKCGFEYYDTVQPKGYWLNGVCIEKIDLMLIEFKNGIGLRYVHQLQNLYFALTGEELIFEI